ncbi:MAG: hypothetical protein ABEJ56_02340 [Candidatus Nanohaloarchaea archaeon]
MSEEDTSENAQEGIDWSGVRKKLRDGDMGEQREIEGYFKNVTPNYDKIGEGGPWDNFPYRDLDEIVETAWNHCYVDRYGDQLEQLILWASEKEDPKPIELGAALKIGVHLTGKQIFYRDIVDHQPYRSSRKTLEEHTRRLKNEIGLNEKLEQKKTGETAY